MITARLQEEEIIVQITAGRGADGTIVLFALTNMGRILRNDNPHWPGNNWEQIEIPEKEAIH